MKSLHEKKENLWRLTFSPLIWAGHFLLSYITAAIWCEKAAGSGGSFMQVRWAIAVYTLIALIGIYINGRGGWRAHQLGSEKVPHDDDTPEDRHRFLGYSTFLLSSISAIAVIFEAFVIFFFKDCR